MIYTFKKGNNDMFMLVIGLIIGAVFGYCIAGLLVCNKRKI